MASVRNLIWKRVMLFKRLEASKTMRAYVAHHMDDSEDLWSKLKLAESELAAARKVADKGAGLLKKSEEVRKAVEAKARRLKKEEEVMDAKCKMAEQETERLR